MWEEHAEHDRKEDAYRSLASHLFIFSHMIDLWSPVPHFRIVSSNSEAPTSELFKWDWRLFWGVSSSVDSGLEICAGKWDCDICLR